MMDYIQAKNIIIEEYHKLLELSALNYAEDIAQLAHLRQKRLHSKNPYFIHPKRIQLLARKLKYNTNVQIISLLHDVIEDSRNPSYYKSLIKSKFGDTILNSILLLTHDKNIDYDTYIQNLASLNTEEGKNAFKVKMLDMLNNLTDAPTQSQIAKYKSAIKNLIEKDLAQEVPPEILKILNLDYALEHIIYEAPKDSKKDSSEKMPKDDGKDSTKNSPEEPPSDSSEKPHGDSPEREAPASGEEEGDNIFSDSPEGDIEGIPANGDEEGSPDSEDNSIVKYNKKLAGAKIIKFQRDASFPEFDFSEMSDLYKKNFVIKSPNGSLMISIPKNNTPDEKSFLEKYVIPTIIKFAYNSIKNGKEVIYMGDYGLPYYNGNYSNDINGVIAQILNKVFKNTISYDTWNPIEYESFISNSNLWKELKKRTEASNSEIKTALYLFLLITDRQADILKKLKSPNVINTLNKWEIRGDDLSIDVYKEDINRLLFPDTYGNPETVPSFIIKTYLQLLKVNILKKVIEYERENKVVIIPLDLQTTWILGDSFKNLNKLATLKNKNSDKSNEKDVKSSSKDASTQIDKKEMPKK